MMTTSSESVFLHFEKLIDDLQDLGFLTECVRNFIVAYVRHLEYLQYIISETIKTYVLEFDEQFYNDKFKISHITGQIRNIPFNDPFYPLHKQIKKILIDLKKHIIYVLIEKNYTILQQSVFMS
ncbi:hypothetical protein NBO_57g0007 [Nosema bombycis CQ1]|uniref:Uncharacterized protein n=1 Tax=Nosema bombycis (strain CQ1 / CVCC 102059) TaxID=578461 RepID=R0MI64_NOSB1|nr:hypothetical protein NBO_57g0007 [Nosema bombycis CQ1]|eukprot:EOB13830.1 hypothetical protein NBO_57g0007 [Nosema bombycis CQ1]